MSTAEDPFWRDIALPRLRPVATPARESIPVLYFNDIAPQIDAADFVEGLLIRESMAVVYGQSNSGKTFWMLDLVLHVVAGMAWNGREVERCGVLWLAMEGSHGISNRVSAWREHHGIDVADLPFAVVPVALDLLTPDGDTERLIETAADVAARLSVPVGLIVVDTLSRAMAGGNENAPDDMGALVTNGTRLQQELHAAVTWIHHSGKDDAKGARGHSLLRAATDTEIEITAEGNSHVARVTKQRELDGNAEFPFSLKVVDLGVNKRGKPVTSCVVEGLDDGHTAGAVPSPRLKGHVRRALDVLVDLLAESGKSGYAGVPQACPSVPEDWWRDRFADHTPSDGKPDTKRKAFVRSVQELQDRRIVGLNQGRAWLIGGSR